MTETTNPQPVDRIPIGRSVTYAVRGAPEIADEYNAARTIAPTEITLNYRAVADSHLGRVSVYVKGRWMQDGKRVPMDKPVGRWLYGAPDAWPDWLAEEARLHDPDAAVPSAPADRAELRDRISEVLVTTSREEWPYTPGQEKWDHHKHGDRPGHNYAISCALCTNDVDRLADAIMPVLPPPADRAAVLREAADALDESETLRDLTDDHMHDVHAAANELRRLADEAQPTPAQRTPCSDPPCDQAPGEPCARHEEEQAHADGEHEYCGVTCEVEFPTEMLRNGILAKGYPGTAGMLDELLRRAAP